MSKQLQQDQDKKKKFEKKWKQDVAPPPSKIRAEGATPGLPVLDYNTSRVDSRQFIEGAKQLLDYAEIHYGRVSYIMCDVGSVVTSQGCVVEQTSSRRDNLKSTL